jgi:hypothetical protein
VVADVLNAYKDYRNETLRVYDAKKRLLLAESYPLPKMTKNTLETIFKENF